MRCALPLQSPLWGSGHGKDVEVPQIKMPFPHSGLPLFYKLFGERVTLAFRPSRSQMFVVLDD